MRKTVDTNVLVRALVDEGGEQSRIAFDCMSKDIVFLPVSVLLETEWVLRSSYRASRDKVADLFRRLLGAENVEIENRQVVAEAVIAHAEGMDFADALHLFRATECDVFMTFDLALRRLNGRTGTPPILPPA
jgi:predicted nucleic-acid-binding protein